MNVSFDVKFTKGLTLENRVEHSTIIHLEIIKEMLSMADLLHRMVLFLKQKEFLNYNVLNLLRYKTNFGAHGFEALVAHENNKLTNSFCLQNKFI
jgi:hypothetical protein